MLENTSHTPLPGNLLKGKKSTAETKYYTKLPSPLLLIICSTFVIKRGKIARAITRIKVIIVQGWQVFLTHMEMEKTSTLVVERCQKHYTFLVFPP